MVMIVNPVLYILAGKEVEMTVALPLAQVYSCHLIIIICFAKFLETESTKCQLINRKLSQTFKIYYEYKINALDLSECRILSLYYFSLQAKSEGL